MPIYDFRCSKCKIKFEKFLFSSNHREVRCKHCGSPAKKLISPVGIIFKGSGFYVTDKKPCSSNKEPAPV